MESKLIKKIESNYVEILNIMKSFLRGKYNEAKQNSEQFLSYEEKLLDMKPKDMGKFIYDFGKKNNKLIEEIKTMKNDIDNLIKEIVISKEEIIKNSNESFFLIKHPKECLFLLQIDKNNQDIYNYLNMIESQINNHNYNKLELIFFIISNLKLI